MLFGGVAEWLERWSWPTNFPYPAPDWWMAVWPLCE